MKKNNPFLLLFIFMGFCLAILYGFFELGDFWMMETTEKILMTIAGLFACVIGVVFCIEIWKSKPDIVAIENSNDSVKIYYCNNSVLKIETTDIDSFFVLCKKDVTVPAKTKMVVYSSAGILSENNFSDLQTLSILCFSGEESNIDKNLYEKLIKDNVKIAICNGNKLNIFKNEKLCSSIVFPIKENSQKNNLNISGKIKVSASFEKDK